MIITFECGGGFDRAHHKRNERFNLKVFVKLLLASRLGFIAQEVAA
jgi:hypothetical protein